MELREFIRGQGWSMFGIVDFKTAEDFFKIHQDFFDKWVNNEFHADMGWLERMREDRYHPDRKLPGLKSMIVLGAIYSHDGSNSTSNSGLIARYARGRDYHKILRKKLVELADWLKSQYSEAETYSSVDSGPTADRVLAEAAGLGFFGKNSCLIDPSKGSYFFIASILTNLELEPTLKKIMPNCGNCVKCQQACPTKALVAPGQIDARKCISYLTIENKEGIPLALRSKIGNRLFGCDVCQEVCPFNIGRAHKQEIKIETLKAAYGAGDSLDLREILSIQSDAEFEERFAGTPLMRAKRRGFLRNACVVAGNSGNKELIPYLQAFVDREADEMLKEHALWALHQLI